MWSSEVNPNTLIDNFAVVVETDAPSKGSWQLDFEAVCAKFNVIKCPQITSAVVQNDKESCRLSNVIIDLSNWRAMLLACCTTGSKVVDISVHGCRLTAQHITDLATALRKMGTCQSVKLQYLDWQGGQGIDETNSSQFQEAFMALFSDATCLESISLKGNNFKAELLNTVISSLSQNFKLVSLNLSNNLLTDETVRLFIKAVRCCTNIKLVSFANNDIRGDCLAGLAELLNGTEQSGEDDATFKGNAKAIGEKNKLIKELNKKRKKAGLPDVKEITPSLEVAIKREKTLYLVNRTLKRVDLSGSAAMDAEKVRAFAQAVADAPAGTPLPQAAATFQVETDPKLIVDCIGASADQSAAMKNVNSNPQPWVQILV
jgi:hypothetical protein